MAIRIAPRENPRSGPSGRLPELERHPHGPALLAAYPHLAPQLRQAFRLPGGAQSIDALYAIHDKRLRAAAESSSLYAFDQRSHATFEDATHAYALHGSQVTDVMRSLGSGPNVFRHLHQLPHDLLGSHLIDSALQHRPSARGKAAQLEERLGILASHPQFNKQNRPPAEQTAPIQKMLIDALEQQRLHAASPLVGNRYGSLAQKLREAAVAQQRLHDERGKIEGMERAMEGALEENLARQQERRLRRVA